MVKHQPLQVYEKQILLSFVTGLYGCRWKRYQRSQDESSKWECVWFMILCSSFLLLLSWVYFWFVAQNDFNEFNWSIYNRSGEWMDETLPIILSTAVGFSYVTFLMILALFHVSLGQQLNLFWLHKVGVSAALLSTLSGVLSVDDIWGEEWHILRVSLQSTAPFLHILALASVTALSWFVAGYVIGRERSNLQGTVMLLYFILVFLVYLAPLMFTCPCIMDRHRLKARPAVIGRRGAPMLAPENTLMSFSRALQQGTSSVEADVSISVDGVPFLMRDHTLRRTTDVGQIFPDRQFSEASFFNWTEIRSLNAGQWFLKSDPYWTVQALTARDRSKISNQTVCSLVEMLRLVARSNSSALINIRKPPSGHPRYQNWFMDTLWAVQKSGISQKRVTWSPDTHRGRVRGFHMAANEKLPVKEVKQRGITSLTLHYSKVHPKDIEEYLANNVSVTVYPVNKAWLYSIMWCSGVPSVSSDAPQVLRKVSYPIWLMNYHMIRWRMSDAQHCNAEWIVLNAVRCHSNRDVNVMKEKLLFSGDLTMELPSPEEISQQRTEAIPFFQADSSPGFHSSVTMS
ncbi:glycerophosphodiester phosphodiesterase domain-containing protein 5 isoform X2 [Takifugu rubripes]|uniref:glycerophosphodiester phosphodiesterase domain-containing protein 5 isoform X2 n=1 Tax=Takifugu rubripes TaxID=31033 RepID=UPI001145831D|nr:glycerophosphodiester phosphodiesterase domain-containing protein 5 isoform X2 [Takifugu rubripes]